MLEDVEAHDPHVTLHWLVRWRQVAVTLLIATFLLVPELLQDTMFCEACDFLPVLAQFILGTGIVGGSSGGGRRKGTNVSAVIVSGFILFMIVAFVVAITILRRVEARMAKAAEATERTISMPGAGGDDAIADPDGAYALKAAKMDVVDAVNADAKHALERCEQGCTNLDEKSESGRQKALQGAMKKFAKMCPQEAKSVTVEFTDQLKGLLGGIQGGLDGPGKDAGKLQSILIGRQKDTLEQIEAARLAEAKRIEMLKA